MPKMKSHSGTKKRFRRSGTGKLMRAKAFKVVNARLAGR